jgi:hypothetical protein
MKAVRKPEPSAEQIQPDPMLLEQRRASPMVIGIAAAIAVLILTVVFYGLNKGGEQTTASSATETPASTSGSAPPANDNAPAPQNKANTAKQDAGSAQNSGQANPAKQGQATPPGKSGDHR